MNEKQKSSRLELYDLPTRDIKISRFFEVAKYLTDNDLWGEVEKKLAESPLIGERIILDSLLGNAVKLVLNETTKNTEHECEPIVLDTIKCGSKPKPPRQGNPGGVRG